MRTYIVPSILLVPFLLLAGHAAENCTVDQAAAQPWVFSSEDGGTSSYLGVDIADVTSERLATLKLKEEKGVEVTMVDQDAPAGKAGIKEHDVILSMNGTAVESGAQLRRMIHEIPAGRVVKLGLSRDGQPMTLEVQLADKHKEMGSWPPKPGDIHVNIPPIHIPDIDIPSINVVMTSSARSGLMVENITAQLGEFFGVKDGNGVLVRSVEKGSRAEKAGFRAGDIIVKINSQPVHDTSDFSHAVKSRSGDSVSVGVVRDKREQTLSLTLPARKESSDLFEEEGFEFDPMIQAESALELSKLRDEMAKLQPEMQLAAEEFRKEFCKQGQEFRKQKKQIEKNLLELQRKFREAQQDWL